MGRCEDPFASFGLTGEGLGIVGNAWGLNDRQDLVGFLFLYDLPNMRQVCSLIPCEAWILKQVVACNPTASIVLAGGGAGITMLERGLDGHRCLFPDKGVDGLAFTS